MTKPKKFTLSPQLTILALLCIIAALIARENLTKRPEQLYQTTAGHVEMCLSCHLKEQLDQAHDTKVLGCSPCHLGDPLAIEKAKAHEGIVKNPGDLRVVDKTCGVEGCHATYIARVKNSLMATNRGILSTLLYYWGEAPDQYGDYSVEQLLKTGENSLALDYFRKLCATCHLWKQKGDLPGVFGEKGGGCTACHYIENPALPAHGPEKAHPFISKKVPIKNCVRCHNRSGRIGISYTGVYESEGYGTPFANGELSEDRLPGDRFFLKMPPDIHFVKGMACIDCHTANEIMGDGKRYVHFEEQLEVTCSTCHTTVNLGVTSKNNTLYNVTDSPETGPVLTGKLDDKKYPLKPPRPDSCGYKGHKRLSCQACHSTWVPQCYGCHVKRDMRETHLDKLTLKETAGWWEEGRSYIRYERPALGIWHNRIMPVTPGCQDIVTLIKESGEKEESFYSFTMAAIDPHTTQLKGRSCIDCHTSPKAVGLGQGTIWTKNGAWFFDPVSQELNTDAGKTPPLDGFVTIDGIPLQKTFRPDMRPFNKEEIIRIFQVGLCLACHTDINDPAFTNYSPGQACPKGEQTWRPSENRSRNEN